MVNKQYKCGEAVPGYDEPVLNEREVRAAAGILFLLALVSFMNAWSFGNFQPIKAFVTVFMLDFLIRVFFRPRYSPSLLLGRVIVSRQQAEYVGAVQKRFAWSLGLALSVAMFVLVVIFGAVGPLNLFLCLTCLTLLFFESAFGICLGCRLYGFFKRSKPKLCAGESCDDAAPKEPIRQLSSLQAFILAMGLVISVGVAANFLWLPGTSLLSSVAGYSGNQEGDCVVPDWAKAIGHENLYLMHHGCVEG